MLTDWFEDFFGECVGQQHGTKFFMTGVNAFTGNVFAEIMQHMAVIVKQAGDNESIWFAILTSKLRCLQCVFEFADVLAIMAIPAFVEHVEDVVNSEFTMAAHRGLLDIRPGADRAGF
jgi:hypothetical protein